MPSKNTVIIKPTKATEGGFATYQKKYAGLRVKLENEDFDDMDDYYLRNKITSDEEYYNIISAGITRPRVFVK